MRIYFIFALNILNNASNLAARVMLPLLAIKLGATPVVVGVVGAAFAMVPAFLAVVAGRLNDRFGSRYLIIFGTLATAIGLLLPAYWPSMAAIFAAALLSGFSQVFCNLSTQNLTGLISTPETRARNFSNYALCNSTGQFFGPVIGGYALEHLPDSEACLALAAFTMLPVFLIMARRTPLDPRNAPSRNKEKRAAGAQAGGAWAMLKDSEVRRTLYSGSIHNSSGNLFMFYMPVYAHSLGVSASSIGLIMAAQASAAFVVRLVLPRLIQEYKEDRSLAMAFTVGAFALILIPFFQNVWMLGLLAFLFGLGMGIGGPVVTMQMFANSAEGRSGEGIGLKMTTNQATKMVSPVLFGAVASAFGLNPMFWLNSMLLGTGAYLAGARRRRKGAAPPAG